MTLKELADRAETSTDASEAERDGLRARIAVLEDTLAAMRAHSPGMLAAAEAALAKHDAELAHRHQRIGRDDARNNMVVNILGASMLEGADADWKTVRAALAEHDEKIRVAALEEAANFAYGFLAGNYNRGAACADAIRALAKEKT